MIVFDKTQSTLAHSETIKFAFRSLLIHGHKNVLFASSQKIGIEIKKKSKMTIFFKKFAYCGISRLSAWK